MSSDRDGVLFGLSALALTALAVAGIILIVFLGWAVGGWFQVQNARRQGVINNIQSHNYVHNYAYQQSQREAVTADMNEVSQIGPQMVGQPTEEQKALGGQRINAIMTLCDDASKVDPSQGPLPDAPFVAANCRGSTINPSSPYETNPTAVNP